MKAGIEAGLVVAASQVVGMQHGFPSGLVSLGVGLIGVFLARWVFVGRENRRLGVPQRWHETLPLTMVAMLITGVIVFDRQLGLSSAAFTGLGVGWAAVLILDVLGERIMNMLRAGFAVPQEKHIEEHADLSGHRGRMTDERDLPADFVDKLKAIDEADQGTPHG